MIVLMCHPTEKRNRLIPLIEYGAGSRYVLISPEEGELAITPDSPEWSAWLASLSSFRFVGREGRFSARRGYKRGPNRSWYAQRAIRQKNYSKYIGVSAFLHLREIATVCYIQFGRRPSHHTIQAVLASSPPPTSTHRRYPPWAEMDDPVERRLAVVRLHAEGLHISSIARYLETSYQTVHATLKRWVEEGVRGLDDKSHAPKHPKRKVTLEGMNEIRKLQENPELGEWRVHAALKDIGIKLSPRTCGRILALNRSLYGLKGPKKEPHQPKEMPFKASRRHEMQGEHFQCSVP